MLYHRTPKSSFVNVLDEAPSINPPTHSEGEYCSQDDNSRNAETQKVSSAVGNDSTRVVPGPPIQHLLTRGLQIPSRTGCPTTGFTLPKVLRQAGISKQEWKAFTHEVKQPANLRISQWMAVLGMGFWTGLVLPLGPLIACVICEKACRYLEVENIIVAGRSGALAICA